MKSLKRGLASDPGAANITSKVFLRSTRSGKVQKVVREQYLRKDIPCSSQLCSTCPATAATDVHGQVPPFVLSKRPVGIKSFPNGHYLIPDTNVLLTGMDVFEDTNNFHDVIVLQTVLEELKNRSLPLYNRLMALTKSEEKRFYLFFNEFRSETNVRREEGESINDRNDRAVRRAASWYTSHLSASTKKKAPTIVILTNDQDNRRKARAEGLPALSLREYVSELDDADRLLDMVAEGQETKQLVGELFYPEYYTASRLATGIKNGTLYQGFFHVSAYNYLEGTVKTAAFDKPLLILGRESSNRSVSGDIVVVEMLPKDQWRTASSKVVDEEEVNANENAENEETGDVVVTEAEREALQAEARDAQSAGSESKAQPTARVVGVTRRNWRQFVGTIDSKAAISGGRQTTVFLMPMDKRIPKVRIRTRQADELVGKRLLATIDAWDRDSRYPIGHYIRSLGELETKEAETEALLLEHDVQYRPFPKAVLDCLPAEGHNWKVPQALDDPGWKGRKDLRELLVCSIDPPGCQDIDDALHARQLPNGNFEVGVHIADVSHFVRPSNAMDAEATARGTTVYLVDKRIDMLPSLLGTDLCSLKPHIERFAFSILWELTPDADVVSASFTKSVIYSREGFSYEQAQKRIDDKSATDDLTQGMRTLLSLSQKLQAKRMAAGALNLSSPEVRIEADSDETSDALADIKTKASLATNSLVEEFMLLANTTVARKIQGVFPQTALLRRHADPPASNFAELSDQLKRMRGFELDVSSSKALAESLDKCVDPAHPFFNTLIRIMATRCMTSAEYFCSGEHAEPEFRHYGLASDIYTHFTSPIRRYADLLVHRQLAYAIQYDGQGSERVDEGLRNKSKLDKVCANLNFRHRNAQMAGRASIEYYVGQALKARGEKAPNKKIEVEGYVMRVFENGIVVFVPQFGVEGLVRLEDFELRKEVGATRESEYDADAHTLTVFEKDQLSDGVKVELFQQLKVRVSSEEKGGIREKGKRRVRIVVISS
ncbi:Exosome complex exonuclease dis3 [Cyphellophora attinorum]|uniref:Ribosomal RNA-processing protein 44 n=1 Tax=Cyphellophora attinorum TaxID=1664694 RepID=A0A0N1P4D7_9EURO|nr:Exosome complex exonuclease dis3 [Phialophora attinorum]KPI45607.1 Exosome complex exonuclease dis3 [Phialophora attinorum]